MLLDEEKSGVGSKRLSRATAFLEAAAHVDRQAMRSPKRDREMLEALADELRVMSRDERREYNQERKS